MLNNAFTLDDVKNNSELTKDCRGFYANIKSLKSFGDYCNAKSFIYLFGNEEGERLWNHFVVVSNRDIFNLCLNYLNDEQLFVLLANIIKNENLRMSTII